MLRNGLNSTLRSIAARCSGIRRYTCLEEMPNQLTMLSRSAAAKQLGLNVRTIDAMIRRQEIKAIKVGRRVLIPEVVLGQSLENFNWKVAE